MTEWDFCSNILIHSRVVVFCRIFSNACEDFTGVRPKNVVFVDVSFALYLLLYIFFSYFILGYCRYSFIKFSVVANVPFIALN